MKIVVWTDKDGYNHRSLLRDSDPDSIASSGVPLDPPSVDQLDWEGIKRDLHNALIDRGLHDMQDVQKQQNGVTSSIISVLKRPLMSLYKMQEAAKRDAMNNSGG